MKVLLSILREMADLPSSPEEIADALNSLGLAVDAMDTVGRPVEGVVTARITRMEKHPDAAKVTRCWVDAGDGTERHVWCGATNMEVGDVVPLATLGTSMPDGRVISRRGILGIDSEGMLCSGTELGLGNDSSGLLVLPPDVPLGMSPFEAIGVEHDVVFDLDLTRNRPDCWGHLGIARDLAAFFKVPFTGPRVTLDRRGEARTVPVEIDAPDRCGLFSVTVVSGVAVGASPPWVVSRLGHLGMRAINNVVDASNLVMLEMNQPNHAYDAGIVSGFRVRLASSGERITTLDGQVRLLHDEDLLICDSVSNAPVGIAGVMGDASSEIVDSTTVLALECAWFSPDPVRFTAQRHGLRTEASVRFERGTDPLAWARAAERFVTILRETCPDVVLHDGATLVRTDHCPEVREVPVRPTRMERTLGVRIPNADCAIMLGAIGFETRIDDGTLVTRVPTWRPDCLDEVDILEEIARHYGYANLGKTVPKSSVHGRLSPMQARRREVRRVMVGLGLDEAMPNPFLAPGDLSAVGLPEEDALRLENPLVADESVLRTSLRPGLLKALLYNQAHRAARIALWEIGHVYPRSNASLPDETEQLGVVVAGGDASTALRQWSTVCDALSVGAQIDQLRVPPGMHPTRSASLARGKKIVGRVGEVDPVVLDRLGIVGRVSILELDLTVLLNENPKPVQARAINRHPSSDVDIAVVAPEPVDAMSLQRALRQAAGARLVEIELFDVYRGPGLPMGSRSLAFRLRLQEPGATLTDGVIAEVLASCRKAIEAAGCTVRS